MDERPSGIVTFLFTDLEGSTGLRERDSPAMDSALRAHDELLTRCLTSKGGYVFSRAGDSFAAAFSSAADALSVAAAVQDATASIDAFGTSGLASMIAVPA